MTTFCTGEGPGRDPDMDAPGNLPAYSPPVDQLLGLGEANLGGIETWPDYPARYGLGPGDVPELVRMATDERLREDEDEGEDPELWAPVHAWRALGQLRAEAAVEPLAALLCRADEADDEWALEELPVVFGRIGRAALPALVRQMGAAECGVYSHAAAGLALVQIATADPSARTDCVAALEQCLGRHSRNDPSLNSFLISYLLDLHASEAAPTIERAFAANDVDLFIIGDWEDVQVELELAPAQRTARPHWVGVPDPSASTASPTGTAASRGNRSAAQKKAATAKHKAATRARKRNRRRK